MSEATEEEVMEIAGRLCEVERDMLLDFAGLETGKVHWGAAMSVCVEGFYAAGLMDRTRKADAIVYDVTPLGRRVASVLGDAKQ